jgi:hypothetical protein
MDARQVWLLEVYEDLRRLADSHPLPPRWASDDPDEAASRATMYVAEHPNSRRRLKSLFHKYLREVRSERLRG